MSTIPYIIGNTEYQVTDPKTIRRIDMQKKKAAAKAKLDDVGATGTEIFSGQITGEEKNIEWQDDRAIENVRDMMRDPVLKGLLTAISLPIIQAEPRIDPASEDNADIEIAQEIEDNLFNNKHFTYGQWIRNLLYFLPFGFETMAKQFEVIDNKYRWRKWKHLKPETLEEWNVDDDGNLESIKQIAFQPSQNKFVELIIEFPNLFHIANEQEGDNFRGLSILRAAYRSWLLKRRDLKKMGIQSQRGAVGTPHAEIGRGVKDSEITDIHSKLENMNVHEKAYLTSIEGKVKMGFFGGKDFHGFDLVPYIQLHNQEMVNAVLANFIIQGQNAVGSYAKQLADIDFFQMCLQAVLDFIEDVFNNGTGNMQHIKQLVNYNHGDRIIKFPKLQTAKIKQDDIKEFLEAVKLAKEAGVLVITKDDEAKTIVREKLGFPEIDPEAEIEPGIEPKPALIDHKFPYAIIDDLRSHNRILTSQEIKSLFQMRHRPPNDLEKRILNLETIEKRLDRVQEDMSADALSFRNAMVRDLVNVGSKILSSTKDVKILQKRMKAIEIRDKRNLANVLVNKAKEIFRFGRKQVEEEFAKQGIKNIQSREIFNNENFTYNTWKQRREEFQKQVEKEVANGGNILNVLAQGVTDDPTEALRSLRPTVESEVNAFANKLKSEWETTLLAQFKSGVINTEQLAENLSSGRISQKMFNTNIDKIAIESFGLGRTIEQVKNINIINKMVRSEILDDNTCSPCVGIDGIEFQLDSPEAAEFLRGPFNGCEGGNLCRGINIAVT